MNKIKLKDILNFNDIDITKCKINLQQNWGGDKNLPVIETLCKDFDEFHKGCTNNFFYANRPGGAKYIINCARMKEVSTWYLFGGICEIEKENGNHTLKLVEQYKPLIKRLILDIPQKNTFGLHIYNLSTVLEDTSIIQILEKEYSTYKFETIDKVNLSFEQLEYIINSSILEWKANIRMPAIYMITDKSTYKRYIGSAYGIDGLWGRWKSYIDTFHGGNKELKELIRKIKAENTFDGRIDKSFEKILNDKNYIQRNFQYSILKVFAPNTEKELIIQEENMFKEKFFTRSNNGHGYNAN